MQNLKPIVIKETPGDLLGIFELSTDEQLAKKIYEATGDISLKGFLPFSWRTDRITKMRDIYERLKKSGNVTALNMAMQAPEISQRAHQYFINNVGKIKGWLDKPEDIFAPLKPILWTAGLVAAAVITVQLVPVIKPLFKKKKYEKTP